MGKSKFIIEENGRECGKCGTYKLWNEFRKNTNRTGHRSVCKDCDKIYDKKYRKTGRITKINLVDKNGRECSKCNIYKPWSSFSRNKSAKNGYYNVCKDCVHEKYRKEHPEPWKAHITEEGRECTKCHTYRVWSDYCLNKQQSTGHDSVCKYCRKRERQESYTPSEKPLKYKITEGGRECISCKVFKSWDNFHKSTTTSTGYQCRCKVCVKDYRKRNKERTQANYRIRYYTDVEKTREERNKKRRKRMENPNRREALNKWVREYRKQPHIKVALSLRSRIKEALKKSSTKKTTKTANLLGCTTEFLIKHLNDNCRNLDVYEENTHIDHIIPVSYFDLQDELEQKVCFNWRNLQLLLSSENIAKGASLPDNVEKLYLGLKNKVLDDIEKGIIYE